MGELPWEEYPRPSLAVDVVVLTVARGEHRPRLGLLVIRRESYAKGSWDLPGAFLLEHETTSEAVRRTLHEKAGVADLQPHLLAVFDDPRRDPRGWVVSLAYAAFVPHGRLVDASNSQDARIAPIRSPQPLLIELPDAQRALPFDHADMVDVAVRKLQAKYDLGTHDGQVPEPDPEDLMTHTPFTLTELRQVYECIQGRPIHRDAFARRFDPALSQTGSLTPAGQVGTGGRPARAFEKRAQAQPAGGL